MKVLFSVYNISGYFLSELEALSQFADIAVIETPCNISKGSLASATHLPLTKKFVSDHVNSWILVLVLVGSDDREYASLSVRQFALNSTELFARFLFSLSAPDRRECFYEWLDLIKHIRKSSFCKIPRWNVLVFRVCAFTRSIVVLWLLCYLPNKLKLMGIHR